MINTRKNAAIFIIVYFAIFLNKISCNDDEDSNVYSTKDPKYREPSPCEVCKFFITELKSRLEESAKSKEIIRTGHGLERTKSFPYGTSELRLTEALLEPHICDKILEYNVHAEREGSNRYAKGMSETFQTLHGLVNKGVKVDLGIPYDMWDQPSAEVTKMQRACYVLAEQYEEAIEDWYYKYQNEDLMDYLCVKRYLKKFTGDVAFNKKCVEEYYLPKGDKGKIDEKKETKSKKYLKSKDKVFRLYYVNLAKLKNTKENSEVPNLESQSDKQDRDEL